MPADITREAFAEDTEISQDSRFGAGDAAHTPLVIRDLDHGVDATLHAWVHERLGRQIGKFAPQIERVEVRFGDVNAQKGGVDRVCLVHIVLSALPPIAVETHGQTDREAFDLAAGRAERALKHTLQRHGFSMGHKLREAAEQDERAQPSEAPPTAEHANEEIDTADSLYGRREGRGEDALEILLERPEKEQPSAVLDTSQPGVSADMRSVGEGHTAKRNTKLNRSGMTHDLEDSTNGQPSRKSTRRSKNHIKAAAEMTLREKGRTHSPQNEAARAGRHKP